MSQTLVIGSGKYAAVAGLTWRPLGADPKTEIRSQCQITGSKYGLLFENPDGRTLFGILPLTAPTKARALPSGAAWIANANDRLILLVKALPGGQYWVVLAGRGMVGYGTDKVLSKSEAGDELNAALSEYLGQPIEEQPLLVIDGDNYPDAHMIERWTGKEFRSFEDLVRGRPAKRPEFIRQLVGIRPAQILAAAAVLVAIGLAYTGLKLYQKRQQDLAFEQQAQELERQKLVAEQIRTATEVRITQAVVTAMAEDTATPPPERLINDCVNAYRSLGTDLGGWRVIHLECNPNGTEVAVDLSLDQGEGGGLGTNATLMDAAARRGWKPRFDLAASRAQIAIPLTAPPLRTPLKPVEAPAFDQVQARFVGRLQVVRQGENDFSFALTNLEPRQAVYLDPVKENSTDANKFSPVPPDRSYRKGTFDLSGRSLWQLTSFSLQYPFVTLTKIELTMSSSDSESINWNLKGHYVSARL